ncbi:nucleoside deaminase [Desulforhopalus sp. 52FAK]
MDMHQVFMDKALVLAEEALADNEFPVGCVIVLDGAVVATGGRNNSTGRSNEVDHAEMMALRSILTGPVEIDLSKVTVYSTMEPCLMCFSTLIVNGVTQFVYGYEDAMGGGTNLPLAQLAPLYRDIRVDVTAGVRRQECLELFKNFFSSTNSMYLSDTYLAQYTLAQ